MPKVNGTRKQKAQELFKMVERGPSISTLGTGLTNMNVEQFHRQYRLWSSSWILPQLKELIRELKDAESTS